MSKAYTTKTAALRATTIDSNIIDANKIFVYPGDGDKTERTNILDLIKKSSKVLYDERGTNITQNDIWGRSIETIEDKTYVRHKWLNATINEDIKSSISQVFYNKAVDADNTLKFNIECDRIKSAVGSFATPSLLKFFGDLSNLEDGSSMFKNTSIKSSNWKLSSLEKAESMFDNSDIETFDSNLPSLYNAKSMFKNTGSMKTFSGSLDNIFDAESMFENSSITSFSSHVPYLYKGTNMFSNSSITNILASFSNLLDGTGMFENTNLTLDSVRMIAETLPQINEFTYDEDGTKTYVWSNGLSFKYYLPQWSDEKGDTQSVPTQLEISSENIGEIMITWSDLSVLSKQEKAIIIYEYFKLMNLKGWTVVTNLYEDLTDSDDNTIEPTGIYYRAIPLETSEGATHTGTNNDYYRVYLASTIHYPEYSFKNTNKWIHVESESDIPFTPIA